SNAVLEVFIKLFNDGLIYRGNRIINWCPKTQTALSDEEVVYQTVQGHLWYIRYPFVDSEGAITVATTRPETMLGDTAVAVNPQDERYQHLIGRKLKLPLTDRVIPIIADEFVKPEFGTGAVKVTPAHDPNDYEMGIRHNLPMINIFNGDATLNEEAGAEFAGLSREEARKKVVASLKELGLLEKEEPYTHEVGYSERGHVPIEPRISDQWFVRMKPLAEPALQAVKDGRIRFYPERWVNTYTHWLENIKDWCISRQLWWGHRIPVWYCQSCDHLEASKNSPQRCPKCGGETFEQDPDVLDTWFSSWLWPFSVFGWPEETEDLKYFYPTSVLVTGPDIIFFWVARMIMAGLYCMGEIPFKDVYFTSIIRDEQGRKLSKSLGNSPDPLDVIAEYGADALRYTIIYLAPVGTDIRYSNEKCKIGRNFANKIWNAARFRQLQGEISENWDDLSDLDAKELRPDDRWILSRVNKIIEEIDAAFNKFEFHAYALNLYEFAWNEFCDWYVESAKSVFADKNHPQRTQVLRIFDYVFSRILRLMHPVMPFLTEEIYHELEFCSAGESLMDKPWPAVERCWIDERFENLIHEKFELIRSGRNLRQNYNLPMTRKVDYIIKPTSEEFGAVLNLDRTSLQALLNAGHVTIDPAFESSSSMPSGVCQYANIYMPLAGAIDVKAERARLEKQRQELVGFVNSLERKLANEQFLARAPEHVVEKERNRHREAVAKLQQLEQHLEELAHL
ncbi:MAG: valine--tRNA ligase, partial [Lentisphaerae bacterium]